MSWLTTCSEHHMMMETCTVSLSSHQLVLLSVMTNKWTFWQMAIEDFSVYWMSCLGGIEGSNMLSKNLNGQNFKSFLLYISLQWFLRARNKQKRYFGYLLNLKMSVFPLRKKWNPFPKALTVFLYYILFCAIDAVCI